MSSTITVPRPIIGSIGSRIRVVLGSSGDEWLLLLDHDDGDKKWQVKDWRSIPAALAKQLNNCTAKGRDCKIVDFDSGTGAWFVNGVKPDGTGKGNRHMARRQQRCFLNNLLCTKGSHNWWGNTGASGQLKELRDARHVALSSTGVVLRAICYCTGR